MQSLTARAEKEWQRCNFQEVIRLLSRIPEQRRSSEIRTRLVKGQNLYQLRCQVLSYLQSIELGDPAAEALPRIAAYLAEVALEGGKDHKVQSLYAALQQRANAINAAVQMTSQARRWGVSIGVAGTVVLLVAVLWAITHSVRSRYLQQMAIRQAVAQGRWDDALRFDPVNIDALLGRARAKLAASPSDLEGAIKDLGLAERQGATIEQLNRIRSTVGCKKAIDSARRNDPNAALKELRLVQGLGADDVLIGPAREAVRAAWSRQAEQAISQSNVDLLRQACRGLEEVGAGVATLASLWNKQAMACIETVDVAGFGEACEEAFLRGLSAEDIAGLWVAFGEAALADENRPALEFALSKMPGAAGDSRALAPLQAGLLTLQARECAHAKQGAQAAELVMSAIDADRGTVASMLQMPGFGSLRDCVTAECRRLVGQALDAAQFPQVQNVIKSGLVFDPAAKDWLVQALTLDRLRTLPAEVFGKLPPLTVVDAVRAIPATEALRLPPVMNSVGMSMRLLHAGDFVMGDKDGESDETPYGVTLTNRFYIGVHEVTNAQWKRVMGNLPSKWVDQDRPVERVTWEAATEFCQRLSALPEERSNGRVYRLPTEAEWEYACRAGTITRRSFGDDRFKLQDFAWFDGNAGSETHPVGQKQPNPWGLHDMYGNVWEWCSDRYGDYPQGNASNPAGPSMGSTHVIRGGGWGSAATRCRSSSRDGKSPSYEQNNLGFRVVADFPMQRASKQDQQEAALDPGDTNR